MPPTLLEQFASYLPPALRRLPWRAHPLDGQLLLFDRHTGLNVLLDGPETAHLRRVAPRSLLIAVTNFCNLDCPFCYRDQGLASAWRYANLLEFCREADEWGVLEVAFGGGEPLIFPRWTELLLELHRTTRLGLNFTTNGTLLTEPLLRTLQGHYGQIRLSLYEDNDWPRSVRLLAGCGARFGVNWLITPGELPGLAAKFERLLALGVNDFLFLGYKGSDAAMHLNAHERQVFGAFVNQAYARLGQPVSLKLDSCWGQALPDVPRLLAEDDCGAGDDMLSITSDRSVKPCSFHHISVPFNDLAGVRRYWEEQRARREAALIGGCARLPERGLTADGVPHHETIHLVSL